MKGSKFQVRDWVGIESAPEMKAHITSIVADECSVGVQYHYIGRLYIRAQFGAKEWGIASGVASGLVRFNEIELRPFEIGDTNEN